MKDIRQFAHSYGPWALVTGASSGIGEEFAYQLSKYGLNLVLLARREEKLINIANKIRISTNSDVRIICADLSNDDYIHKVVNATCDIDVGLLVNSAGFAVSGDFIKNNLDTELAMLSVNCKAPLYLTHHFANKMIGRERGGIIFLSSIVAFSAINGWAGYSASKSHNLLFSESLAYELLPYNIDVVTLCPGATRTEFLKKAGLKQNIGADVSSVVSEALYALGVKKIVIPGFQNKYNIFWSNIFPRRFNVWFSSLMLKRHRSNKD